MVAGGCLWLLVECQVMTVMITQHNDHHKHRHYYHQALAARGFSAVFPVLFPSNIIGGASQVTGVLWTQASLPLAVLLSLRRVLPHCFF